MKSSLTSKAVGDIFFKVSRVLEAQAEAIDYEVYIYIYIRSEKVSI